MSSTVVMDLRMKVISLHQIIRILPSIVWLCMFTLTATAPGPAEEPKWPGTPIAHVKPKEGMER